ncbi:dienelactone hydrolase family protein [Gallaecimonas sp. GXIMD4217]|uniref:dienelactone hydrolase family protein n=1 Tax=Gallaecimonas sp. GXIMD4217 TaxID=3131927 RepID=UPI00311B2211
MNWYWLCDIYGATDAARQAAGELGMTLIAPYEGQQGDDGDVHGHFQAWGGWERYLALVKERLAAEHDFGLLGFSVGAAIAWVLAAEGRAARAIGFYGGQCRHFTELTPRCDTTLIWPHAEDHFELDGLICGLAGKEYLTQLRTGHRHGFMNPHSQGFDNQAALQWLTWLKEACH